MEKLERVHVKRYSLGVISTDGVIKGVPAPSAEVADGREEHYKQAERD
jgi:hypothetical protein